jgi:hypothetical protein
MIGYATGSPVALAVIAIALVGASIAGAVVSRHRAPAVTLGLVGALIAAVVGFAVAGTTGPHGVPQAVGIWASLGLAIFGLFGLLVLRGRPPARQLWRATVTVALIAPFAAATLRLAVGAACPLYVTKGAGYCFYDVDLLGGWAAAVTVMLAGDLLGIAFLLGVSAWQARRAERAAAAHTTAERTVAEPAAV